MTQRLFLEDSHLFETEAVVLSCEEKNGAYEAVFDRTVFFPNKGGQPCDIGSAGEAEVTACNEKGETLVHTLTGPLTVGETVKLRIDRERRLDIMRQHTGEHILSWAAYTLYGAVNVGFHCALDYATLDTDLPLTPEQLEAMETLTNEVVMDDRPVTAVIYETEEELEGVPLRKHTEGLEAPIRVVTVENADSCTCCAPHVKHTGEIGLVKIVQAAAYKGGMRITFLCGGRALQYAREQQKILTALARQFSTGTDKVLETVLKQTETLDAVKKNAARLSARLETYLTAELKQKAEPAGKCLLLVEEVESDPKRLRPLAESTLPEKGVTLLFAKNGGSVGYILMSRGLKENMGEWLQAVNAALNGKGGGRGDFAQGSAPDTLYTAETVAQLKGYLAQRLKSIK